MTPPATPTPIATAREERAPAPPSLLLREPLGATEVVTVAINEDWEPLGRVVRAREVVMMIVPVSVGLLLLREEGLVGVGVELASGRVGEEPDATGVLGSAARVLLWLDVLNDKPKKSI